MSGSGRIASILAAACGAALGACLRVLLVELPWAGGWPWATLLANVLGCALLGIGLQPEFWEQRKQFRVFWSVGLCGGLSTVSTFVLELHLLYLRSPLDAFSYGLLSFALGWLALQISMRAGQEWYKRRAA